MRREPFELPGDDRGVLCIHGFTGTPHDMRFLGESLAHRGLTVSGIALPGHATRVEELEPLGHAEWTASVLRAYDDLAARCRRVAVVGQSMGGLLAMWVATRRPGVAAVATLAAPLWFEGLTRVVARATTRGVLRGRVRYLPKVGGPDVRDPDEKRVNPSYRAFPVRALGQLMDFMEQVDAALPEVRAPLLVLHGEHDHTAPVGSAQRIAARAAASELRLRILPESFHLLANDVERTVVAAEVGRFVERHTRS
jgi:carboxylesterase